LEAKLARIEARRATRRHVGVILCGPDEDPAALVAEAAAAGRIAPGYGVAVLPRDAASIEEWEAAVQRGDYRGERFT
jgi:hypothetical protein